VLEGSQESHQGVVVLGANGAIEYVGAYARELLDRYFGFDLGGRLPDAVQAWLHRESTRLNGDGALGQTARPLTVKRGDRRIVVARVRDVLVVREEVGNLTRREREILALVAEGRSNTEIAAKLWLSAGTVRIHLQHIYAKLGVGNRTAAVAHFSSVRKPRRV
jgi:DNA-binding CsgD family transcriptional regulator